jgi:fructuronate reductase
VTDPLSSASPAAAEAVRRRQGAQVGVVHFGPGAFHRAHQGFYFDRLMGTDPRWAIAGVSLKSAAVRDALVPQDGLYALAELDHQSRFEIVGSIMRLLVAPEAPNAVLDLLASPQVGVVTMTVTEKGYCLDGAGQLDLGHPDIAADLAAPQTPVSLVGYLVEGLRRRRAARLAPPVIVSCDNLADNGPTLKAAVVRLAGEGDAKLARWIEGEAVFPRTMVDSITPATDAALKERVARELGVLDAWPVQREAFVQWVIEDVLPMGGPDLASVGVQLTGDVAGYERAKLRLLNGAHSTLAYMGLLRGHATVLEAMADARLADFVSVLMREDILPTVHPPAGLDAEAYIEAVLGRFRNPAIVHTLAQIAWDGSKKLPIRLLATLAEARAAGRPIERLARPIAAWMAFVVRQARAGVDIVDPIAGPLAGIGGAGAGRAADVEPFLALSEVFPPSLAADPVFRAAVTGAYLEEAAIALFGRAA